MILKIRNSIYCKATSIFLALIMLVTTFQPVTSYALTGGPAQPEFNSFTPIGTSDMVDLASGDFSYNIPLMDVGGFPINLAYSSGVSMDQEASWVGLGWDLSIGQINRQMRGFPDDFDGDQVQYENNIKDNTTIGASFTFNPAIFGTDGNLGSLGSGDPDNFQYSVGVGVEYNTYNGISIAPSFGMTYNIAENLSVGMNVKSNPDGLSIYPSASLQAKKKSTKHRDVNLGASVGVNFNSRQGLSALTLNASASSVSEFAVSNKEGNKLGNWGSSASVGGTVSYVNNTYTPQVQDGLNNYSGTFNAALGAEFFGGEGQGQIAAYFTTQMMSDASKDVLEKTYGYDNTHKAHKNDVLDFNREKDGNFSVNTTHLPLTNYTYDIYSVQGQGVSGMFRPFRSQVGYVYDNRTTGMGVGGSFGIELGVGNAVHSGFDVEVTTSFNESGDWVTNNQAHDKFKSNGGNDYSYEEVYYKNVGDLSVDEEIGIYESDASLAGKRPIRLKLGGTDYNRTIENKYQVKNATTPGIFTDVTIPAAGYKRHQRVKRNQAVQKLTVAEVQNADTDGIKIPGFTATEIHTSAQDHHTAGYIVTRNDGARYVYGKALYNTTKREVTFAAAGLTSTCSTGLVTYTAGVDNSINNDRGDHYFNRVTTPAYAHTYLLTCLLSSDYSDISNNGPTPDDLGSYTKFAYRNPLGSTNYRWRVPLQANTANYNEGLRTDPDDDKGSYVYGEKEIQFIQKIETKTHVALFYISPRHDSHGVVNENGGRQDSNDMFKLDKISLFSKGEYVEGSVGTYGNISTTSIPIKEVHFEYDYSLCPNVPNNDNAADVIGGVDVNAAKGKLTLKKVYFTYRESKMGKYSPYEFTYGDTDHNGTVDNNPGYDLKSYDIWGNYKPSNGTCGVTAAPTAAEFPYVDQVNTTTTNLNAQAWSMTDIGLPSGGNIKVDYESDDYHSVQDMGLMRMFKVAGCGPDAVPAVGSDYEPNPANTDATLYKTGVGHFQSQYLYIQKPAWYGSADPASTQLEAELLTHIRNYQDQLIQFRFFMNMSEAGGSTSGSGWMNEDFDYVTGYFELGTGFPTPFTVGTTDYVSIPMKMVDMEGGVGGTQNVNPISKTGWHFARKYLSRYAYGLSGVDEGESAEGIIYQLTSASILNNLLETFQGPNGALKNKKVARRFIKDKSWIRLMDASGHKKGGGVRVKQLAMTDEWATMNADDGAVVPNDPRDQMYGQVYSYNLVNGKSSGVATYEPVGCKENPYVRPVYSNANRLLAPDEENYIEQPFGESFFPAPTVTYGRVSVKNLERVKVSENLAVKKHATGEVITEFYTSRDYPTMTDQTWIQVEEDDNQLLQSLLNINVKKHITLSQGYVIHLNDMNGKMKSQRVYAEGAAGLSDYISGVDYVYDGFSSTGPGAPDPFTLVTNNTGKLNNNVKALYPNGLLDDRVMGVEYDVINDFREMSSSTEVVGINTNVATFFIGIIPGIVPVPLPDYAHHEDKVDMVSTTKVINSFGILRETIAHDAGASVSTRNLVWDAYTGEVLLTETVNEYGDKYYSLNYPAHWNYSGMGMASLNSNLELPFIPHGSVVNGYKLPGGILSPQTYLHNGDEVLVTTTSGIQRAWVNDLSYSSFRLLNSSGAQVALTGTNTLKVLRSGRRNIQSTSMASMVSMTNPTSNMVSTGDIDGDGVAEVKIPTTFYEGSTFKVVNAGAVEFADAWSLQCECGIDNTQNNYNPYLYNTKGVWRAKRSHLYLTGRTTSGATDPSPRKDGYYATFSPFYQINTAGKWTIVPTDWTFTSQVTQFNNSGFELENEDALHRYSAAQYGYNFTFPLAVGANGRYSDIGFDGFEDYLFTACNVNEHFGFRAIENSSAEVNKSNTKSHTGTWSLAVNGTKTATRVYHLTCVTAAP
ncbi:MAG: hypothetical protein HYZ14_02450 [Bacteroidetes bacterium]|nr:hypothetical protein [Bacteroidota bacterium]